MLFENCCNLLIWIQIFYKVRNIFKKSSVRISFMSSFAVSLWFCTREKLNFLNKRLFYLLFWSPCFHRSMLRTRHGSLAQLIPEQTVSSWLPRIVPHVPQSYPEHNAVNSSVFPRPHPFFCYFFCLRVEFNHRKKKNKFQRKSSKHGLRPLNLNIMLIKDSSHLERVRFMFCQGVAGFFFSRSFRENPWLLNGAAHRQGWPSCFSPEFLLFWASGM